MERSKHRWLHIYKNVVLLISHLFACPLAIQSKTPRRLVDNMVPYKQKYKDAKNVQRRTTNQLPSMKDIPYQEKLERLKLPTLAYRRTRGDMIEEYKLLQGKHDSDVSNIVKLHKDSETLEKKDSHLELTDYGMIYRKQL